MSYHEQAEKINELLKKFNQNQLDNKDKKDIINAILRFGQVAKYRCRSNTAYDNFATECFQDIAELERVQPEGLDFEILRVRDTKSKRINFY